jgi:hypothetical protein
MALATDRARVTDKPDVIPGQKSASGRSPGSPFELSRWRGGRYRVVVPALSPV